MSLSMKVVGKEKSNIQLLLSSESDTASEVSSSISVTGVLSIIKMKCGEVVTF